MRREVTVGLREGVSMDTGGSLRKCVEELGESLCEKAG